jgi:hypothetical protein
LPGFCGVIIIVLGFSVDGSFGFGRLFVFYSAHVKKKKKNRAFFFLTVFSPRFYVERSHQNLPFASVPRKGLEKSLQSFWKLLFPRFCLFLPFFFFFFFGSFRFLFIFFYLFSSFLWGTKTRKQKDTPKKWRKKTLCFFLCQRKKGLCIRPFQPLLLAFTYETIFKAVQGTYCHLTLRARDQKLGDQFEANWTWNWTYSTLKILKNHFS